MTQTKIRPSNPATIAAPDGHFSQAMVVQADTSLLYISGQVPRFANGQTGGVGDMTAQAEIVFANLSRVLEAHRSTFANVIKATIYVTDMSKAHEVTEVRERYYGDARPASTFVGVNALGDPHWMLEVEVIAAL
jgi:2-iminobutanoate/2-iminopropanoate deaminase